MIPRRVAAGVLAALMLVTMVAPLGYTGEETPDAPPHHGLLTFRQVQERLMFNRPYLGMTIPELESWLGARLLTNEAIDDGFLCSGRIATVPPPFEGPPVGLTFVEEEGVFRLAVVFVPFAEPRALAPLRADLRARAPALRYRPPRHAADLDEEENPKPFYVHRSDLGQAVLLDPSEGLWLTRPDCVD